MNRVLRAMILAAGLLSAPAELALASGVGPAGPDQSVMAGDVVQFEAPPAPEAPAAPGGVLSYGWAFGDGGSAEGRIVRHAYRAPGVYAVRLDWRGPGGLAAHDTAIVTVRPRPNVPPLAVARGAAHVRVGEPLVLDARASRDADGALLAYRWRVEGIWRDGRHVTHAFHAPGLHVVMLEVEDDRGARARDRLSILVSPAPNQPPVAEAGADRVVAPGETVRFDGTASSDGDGDETLVAWVWAFGDGAGAQGPVAEHAYVAPGRYRARLTVEDASGRPNGRATDEAVVVVNAPPVARAGPDRQTRDTRLRFDASASHDTDGRLIGHRWDFGDGASAEGPVVSHDFRRPGTYAVTLTVTDDSGAANAVASDRVTVVIDPAPDADAGPPRRAVPGEAVVFRAGEVGGPGLVALWEFGDGTRQVGRVAEKRFARPGRHPVRLTIRDAEGGPALATDETHVIVNPPPVARAGPDLRTAPGEPLRLDAGASFDPDGTIGRYVWTIGEVTRRSPIPALTRRFGVPGRYPVMLTVIDESGAANAQAHDSLLVSVNAPPAADAGPDRVLADRTVRFDASASHDPDGDPLSYRWDFGDGTAGAGVRVGHVYAAPGRYRVRIEVDDGTGFSNAVSRDEATVVVNAAPIAEAGPNIAACAGNVVNLDAGESADPDGDALSHLWHFDDGVSLAGGDVRRTFDAAGNFGATLVVDDGTGVANATARDRVFVSVDPRPRAEAGPDREACVGETITFDGTRSTDLDGAVNAYRWQFGDGTGAEGPRPVHAYSAPGTYRVALTIEGDPLPRCDNRDVDWTTVRVSDGARIAIDGPGTAAPGEPLSFRADVVTPAPENDVLAYDWRFSDGVTATGRVVSRSFDAPGDYTASVAVTIGGLRAGCAAVEAAHAVSVNAPPVAVIDAPRVAVAHRPVRLDGSGSRDPDGVLTAYRWALSDGTRLTGPAPEHVFARTGRYDVTLRVEDGSRQANAAAEAAVPIEVVDALSVTLDGPEVSCLGDPVTFRAQLDDGALAAGDVAIAWDLGDGARSETVAPTHVYRMAGRHTVTAAVDAAMGGAALSAAASRTLRVNSAPVAEPGPDIAACLGAAVYFDGSRSFDPDGDALSAWWEFGDGAAAEGLAARHRYGAPGLYRARLWVDDGAGAPCSRSSAMRTVAVNAPPRAEAGGPVAAQLIDGEAQVTLDAVASSDPEGRPLRHVWSVDGGERVEGRRATFRFDRPGRYLARLNVSDGTGLPCGVASDTAEITIAR